MIWREVNRITVALDHHRRAIITVAVSRRRRTRWAGAQRLNGVSTIGCFVELSGFARHGAMFHAPSIRTACNNKSMRLRGWWLRCCYAEIPLWRGKTKGNGNERSDSLCIYRRLIVKLLFPSTKELNHFSILPWREYGKVTVGLRWNQNFNLLTFVLIHLWKANGRTRQYVE